MILSLRIGQKRLEVYGEGLGSEHPLKDFRKDMIIEILNEAGQLIMAYKVYRCWISEYQALPDLEANTGTLLIEYIKLEVEGWERDESVTEPEDPTLS